MMKDEKVKIHFKKTSINPKKIMFQKIKSIVKYLLPKLLTDNYKRLKAKMIDVALDKKIKKAQSNHEKTLKIVRNNTKIKVAFFLPDRTVWKLEGVYRLMQKNNRFDPIVVICPFIAHGKNFMLQLMKEAYDEFQLKGYQVIKAYNESANRWLDIKKEINPDVIFFLNPGEITKREYYIFNFPEKLTCYVPYGYMLSNTEQTQFNKNFHNLTWKNFYETEMHKKMAMQFARNRAVNVVVSGAPMCDKLQDISYEPEDPWKHKHRNIKRIIWAPHHTIEENSKKFGYSNFISYCEIFPDLLNRYQGKIQIAFKPHPLLKPKLYKHKDWGVERTDEYFKRWEDLPNGQLFDGTYEDLFLTSDALILDSISFLAEYIFTGKPCLFMVKDESINKKFNEFGRTIYDLVYKSHNISDLYFFIEDTVMCDNDKTIIQRKLFKENVLNPPNHKTASQNIFDFLAEQFK